jgi:hypothetical protein
MVASRSGLRTLPIAAWAPTIRHAMEFKACRDGIAGICRELSAARCGDRPAAGAERAPRRASCSPDGAKRNRVVPRGTTAPHSAEPVIGPRFARTRWLRAGYELHQLHGFQTGMPVLADDEMVVHGDAERARDVDDRLGHLDVGARGRRIAGGMIVQNQIRPSSTLISFHFCCSPG